MNRLILSLMAVFLLSGCAPAVVGGAAAGGVAVAQEGGLKRALSDTKTQIAINDLWFQHNVEMFRKLDMTIDNGRVLLTGVVQDPEHRLEAVRLAWQAKGVKQVMNEITVSDPRSFREYSKDKWIATRLRAGIIGNGDVKSINYSIDVIRGVVYLMGTAQSHEELELVTEKAGSISGVQRVVSYVQMRMQPEEDA